MCQPLSKNWIMIKFSLFILGKISQTNGRFHGPTHVQFDYDKIMTINYIHVFFVASLQGVANLHEFLSHHVTSFMGKDAHGFTLSTYELVIPLCS